MTSKIRIKTDAPVWFLFKYKLCVDVLNVGLNVMLYLIVVCLHQPDGYIFNLLIININKQTPFQTAIFSITYWCLDSFAGGRQRCSPWGEHLTR